MNLVDSGKYYILHLDKNGLIYCSPFEVQSIIQSVKDSYNFTDRPGIWDTTIKVEGELFGKMTVLKPTEPIDMDNISYEELKNLIEE